MVLHRRFAKRKRSHKWTANANNALLQDPAIKRYFNNIASKHKNAGHVSTHTIKLALLSIRSFLAYLDIQPSTTAVSNLVKQATSKTAYNKLCDQLQDFSNQQPIQAHRSYATYIKGIFKANRLRLETFVDNHFSKKTRRISESLLAQILTELPNNAKLIIQLQAYAGERIDCLGNLPITQYEKTPTNFILHIQPQQCKTRIEHPSIIPLALGEQLIQYAKSNNYTSTFPNHKTIWRDITRYVQTKYNVHLTSHYLRKRYSTIADKESDMAANDWDYLQGSKQHVRHCTDIYQLDDIQPLLTSYHTQLEPLLEITTNRATQTNTTETKLAELEATIKSQQQTIDYLTKKLLLAESH